MSGADRLRLAAAGLHPHRRNALVARHGSVSKAVAAIVSGSTRVPDDAAAAVRRSADETAARCHSAGVSVIDREEPAFPRWLRDLPDGPDVLFVRGSVDCIEIGVAIVGTRRCTAYGVSLARRFGSAISGAGWAVVSGLARGIDGAAHEGSLDGPGAPIAVLGCGADVVYPAEHRRLADRILAAGGAIISEYPPGAQPLPWRFPPRNRLIAALGAVVVVVESSERGGSLVTASAAADLGRTVMAVPGDVDRAASVGCNLLLRDGAVAVLGPADLVEAASLALGLPAGARASDPTDPLEQAVLAAAASGIGLDELAARVGAAPGAVLAAVSRLEVGGRLLRDGGRVVGR